MSLAGYPPARAPHLPADRLAAVRIAATVRQSLSGCGYPALRQVSALYEEGVLTLRGRLPSYHLKQIASAVSSRIEGVERIANEIDVIWPETDRA